MLRGLEESSLKFYLRCQIAGLSRFPCPCPFPSPSTDPAPPPFCLLSPRQVLLDLSHLTCLELGRNRFAQIPHSISRLTQLQVGFRGMVGMWGVEVEQRV